MATKKLDRLAREPGSRSGGETKSKATTKAKPKKKPRVLSAKTGVRAGSGVMLVLGKGPVPS